MIGERTHVSTQGRCEVPCTGLVAVRCLVGGGSPIGSMYGIMERERERKREREREREGKITSIGW